MPISPVAELAIRIAGVVVGPRLLDAADGASKRAQVAEGMAQANREFFARAMSKHPWLREELEKYRRVAQALEDDPAALQEVLNDPSALDALKLAEEEYICEKFSLLPAGDNPKWMVRALVGSPDDTRREGEEVVWIYRMGSSNWELRVKEDGKVSSSSPRRVSGTCRPWDAKQAELEIRIQALRIKEREEKTNPASKWRPEQVEQEWRFAQGLGISRADFEIILRDRYKHQGPWTLAQWKLFSKQYQPPEVQKRIAREQREHRAIMGSIRALLLLSAVACPVGLFFFVGSETWQVGLVLAVICFGAALSIQD